ncbi:hypothetical protein EIN_090840, partial [Entamoeba invadens IP1]
MCTRLDRYSMMIISKYFTDMSDYKNMVFICRKFQEIPEMFHFNPISITLNTQRYFPNVETLHLYNETDKFLPGYYQYYVHYPIPLYKSIEINKRRRVICPLKTYSFSHKNDKFLYKDATVFVNKAFCHIREYIEMDCSNIIKFGHSCFAYNNSLVTITLSSNLYEIPDKCFYTCAKLKEINLEHIRMFGEFCFYWCDKLSAITLGTNIVKSAKKAFDGVSSIKNVIAPGVKSVDFDVNASISYAFCNIKHKTVTTEYDKNVLPDFLSDEIRTKVFRNRIGLSDINLASTVTVIEDDALSCCDMERLDLSHVISFGVQNYMTRLTAITLNKNVRIDNFWEYTGLKKISAINTQKVNVKAACWMKDILDENLEVDEFYYTYKDVDHFKGKLPLNYKNFKTIILDVNFGNYKYEEVEIPMGITMMRCSAFLDNEKLRKLVFPTSYTKYDRLNFTHLNLEELCITPQPKLVISNCPKLTSLTLLDHNVTNYCMFN